MQHSENPDTQDNDEQEEKGLPSAPVLPDETVQARNEDDGPSIDKPVGSEDAQAGTGSDGEEIDDPDEAETSESEGLPKEYGSDDAVAAPETSGKLKRFFTGYWHRKKWTIPLTLLLILAGLLAVPAIRYPVLALRVQRSFVATIIDSKTHTPISGARVTIAGKTSMSNSNGVVHITAKVGSRTIRVQKQYYKSFSEHIFVGISTKHNTTLVKLNATGRQVPVSVINTLTGKRIANVQISVLKTEARTNATGMATIVLPTAETSYTATITASGYNTVVTKVTVTNKVISSNAFSLTPSGKVYFLSNLSGTINVDSANLDGTNRQAILTGTGNEDANSTFLYNSSDWKYLVLQSRRSSSNYDQLYLINTSNNQETSIDITPGYFQAIGWSGHTFVYELTSATLQNWQPGQEMLKSYDADTGKTTTLDKTSAVGTDTGYAEQTIDIDPVLVNGVVVYAKVWTATNENLYNGKSDEIASINPDGSSQTVLKSFPMSNVENSEYINATSYSPQIMYFALQDNAGTTYYIYQNGNLTQTNTMTAAVFFAQYPTYHMSPSGNESFWSTVRDGQNALLVGDAGGGNANTIATLTSYAAYGWYTDNYVLVSKGSNTLYIMPVDGGKATKIADYFQ